MIIAGSAAAETVDQPSTASPTPPPAGLQTGTDIVVTATKRNETLQDVPIQIQVLTEASLVERGITEASELLSTSPNVTYIEDNAGETYINIRGQTAVRGSDPNVAIVIDGVTLSSTKAFNRNIFGIQQIEIVKGPQTALYGRNAAAGAIVITTKKPGDDFEGEVDATYGKFGTLRASAAISGPLTDTIGFSIAGSTYHTDGPFKSVITGANVFRSNNDSIRGRLFFDNGSNFTADLKADFFKVTGAGISYNAQLVGLPIPPFPGTALDFNFTDQPFVSNVLGENDNKFYGGTLKLDYDFGPVTLTSITGINRYEELFGGDGIPYISNTGAGAALGAVVNQYTVHDTNISQELRLTSNGKTRLRYQLGAYFLSFKRDAVNRQSEDNLGAVPANPREVAPPGSPDPTLQFDRSLYDTKDYAVFANVQYDIIDELTISLAGRYDIEKRSIRSIGPLPFNKCATLNNIPIDQCHASKTFKEFSPKATISYQPNRSMLFFASYGKGFKSGGFNPIGTRAATLALTPPALQPFVYVQDIYSPEKARSYEIGTKLQLLDGKFNFSGSVFDTTVSGAQQFAFSVALNDLTVVSIDKVKLKGFDAGIDWTAPFGTSITVGVGYVDAKVTKFVGNPVNEGNVAPGSAEYTIFVGVQQPIELDSDFTLTPRVEYNRSGRIWWDVDNTPGTKREPVDLTNARLTLKHSKGWQVAAWVDNVFNEKYYQEIVPILPILSVGYRGWTRSFGIDARFDF